MSKEIRRPDYQLVIKKAEKFFSQSRIRRNPPIDVEEAAKNLGITILRNKLEGDVSGYLFISKGHPPIIGVNSVHGPERQRFTIGHELGHFLIHARSTEDVSFVDKNFFIINRDARSAQGVDTDEIEANFFAAEVLMPAESLYRDLASVSDPSDTENVYTGLAKKYNVSKEAIKFRLNFLGYLRL